MTYNEYQKKELGWGLNAFNRPVEYSGVNAWVRLLTNLLFMIPGTYPTSPTMGIGLQTYRFEFEDILLSELQAKIEYQIQTYLPGIPIHSVNVSTETVEGTKVLVIQFDFQVSDQDLQTAYVAMESTASNLNFEVAF